MMDISVVATIGFTVLAIIGILALIVTAGSEKDSK